MLSEGGRAFCTAVADAAQSCWSCSWAISLLKLQSGTLTNESMPALAMDCAFSLQPGHCRGCTHLLGGNFPPLDVCLAGVGGRGLVVACGLCWQCRLCVMHIAADVLSTRVGGEVTQPPEL